MQLFGGLNIKVFVRISRLMWIGHLNRMDSKRKLSQVFNNNSQGRRIRGRPKNKCWKYIQTVINKCKVQIGKRDPATELTGKSPIRSRRTAVDCSAIEELHMLQYLRVLCQCVTNLIATYFVKNFNLIRIIMRVIISSYNIAIFLYSSLYIVSF